MARTQNKKNNSPPNQTNLNLFDSTISKITSIGGAVLVLFSVGGGAYKIGGTFKENEKNIEIFDLKQKHKTERDSLLSKVNEKDNEIRQLKSQQSKSVSNAK